MKNIFTGLFILLSLHSFSQGLTISGTAQDTTAKIPLPNAVVIAVRFQDSVLVKFTRTDKNGYFKLSNLPIDTYQVIVSHKAFGDKAFYAWKNNESNTIDFGKFSLPPKSVDIKEVVIYGFKDPVYYKGDTLVYTADSFKVKANATVEDLLKRLPGMKVDAQGKITVNGEQVDQVLVDGDEFFGSDQTIATRNLNASSVESVHVYDKQNDNQTGDASKDKIKVMDLKLKDDAKKGYFGKAAGAGDFNKFYEGTLLANKFTSTQKISGFALGSNTPNNYIGWNDTYKYGLNTNNNQGSNNGDDDNSTTYYSNGPDNEGIPRVFKTGAFYSNKFSSKTKLTANYVYTNEQRQTITNSSSQYFLPDTTFKTENDVVSSEKTESHYASIDFTQSIDSLTDFELQSNLTYSAQTSASHTQNNFITADNELSRSTSIENDDNSKNYTSFNKLMLRRHFKKKDRLFTLSYTYNLNQNTDQGFLKSGNYYASSQTSVDSINQKKNNLTNTQSHTIYADYVEPLSKKIKLDFSYNANLNISSQDIQTLDYLNGDYSRQDSLLTNNFKSTRTLNRAGAKFSYEIKKQRIYIGTFARTVTLDNTNLINGQGIHETINNLLPYASYSYVFSDNRRLSFQYVTSSNQPTVSQLQPVFTNANPNYIMLGNINLLPTFKNQFGISYYSSKPISGNYIYTNISFATIHHDISNSVQYDSIGRTITQSVNVNGDYLANGYLYSNLSFLSRVLSITPNLNFNYSGNSNFINGQKNVTTELETGSGLDVGVNLDKVEFSAGGRYTYNLPSSSLNNASNTPYSTQDYNSNLSIDLPKKFKVQTTVDYTINTRRYQGYNIQYTIWNASISKTFFKKENFILSLAATDLLNQNINVYRTVVDNVITDVKSNVVGRYYLLRAVFKFDSTKKKAENDDEE